jgi:hypothetical protein
LKNLELHHCARVTGRGSRVLKACVDFNTLALVNIPITPAGLEELAELPGLSYLNLSSLDWTPAHLTALAKLHLGHLAVASSGIDDATAEQLAHCGSAFTKLNVAYNPLTDRGLLAFKKLKHLVRLDVRATGVSAEGIADLQAALPDCEILSP